MKKPVELPVNAVDLDHISQEQFQVRSTGLHVSTIIKHIMVTSGLKKMGTFTDDDLNMFAIVGRLWERMLAETLFPCPRYVRPGELEFDGVFGSPDAIDVEDGVLHEYKVTWRSTPPQITDFIEWQWQMKAYLHMLGLTRAQLYVFFVCGNYRPPVPIFKAWEFTYVENELKDNWRFLMENRP